MIIYQPISLLASLRLSPFFVREAVRVQIQLNRDNFCTGSLLITPQFGVTSRHSNRTIR